MNDTPWSWIAQSSWNEHFEVAWVYIKDTISSFTNFDIQEQCYASSVRLGEENPFCDVIKRDADGQIEEVLQRSYNIDELSSRGIEIVMAYKYDLNEFGSVNFGLNWTHLLEHSTTKTGVDGVANKEDFVGFVGFFEDKATASVTWSLGEVRVNWSASYKSSALRSITNVKTWEKNIERCASKKPEEAGCITDPEPIAFQEYDAYFKHNVSASYNIEMKYDASVRIFGGVNNVFDDKGQFYVGGRGNFGSEYDAGRGRFVYLVQKLNSKNFKPRWAQTTASSSPKGSGAELILMWYIYICYRVYTRCHSRCMFVSVWAILIQGTVMT